MVNLHESSDFNRFLSSRSLALRADARASSIADCHVSFALVRSSGFPHVRNITNTDATLQIGVTFRGGGCAKQTAFMERLIIGNWLSGVFVEGSTIIAIAAL